jgi:AcrR family transcriptional regulator
MGRWAPDARGRLQYAAMELFAEQGYDTTTVVEITERAGLTERTFYRHFADKREVLFSGAVELLDFLVEHVEREADNSSPIAAVINALRASAEAFFDDRRDFVQFRQHIIDANVDLQERELVKLASLSSALAAALQRHGVESRAARLSAESGLSVFRIAFADWVNGESALALSECIRSCAAEFAGLAALSYLGDKKSESPGESTSVRQLAGEPRDMNGFP